MLHRCSSEQLESKRASHPPNDRQDSDASFDHEALVRVRSDRFGGGRIWAPASRQQQVHRRRPHTHIYVRTYVCILTQVYYICIVVYDSYDKYVQ